MRNSNLDKAFLLSNQIQVDSLKNRNFLNVAFKAYKDNDSIIFNKANRLAFTLSSKLKDTISIAETHWNYGSYFSKKEKLDSSYYHYFQAQKYYEVVNHENYSAKMLYNMAFIQSKLSDYSSAEAKLFQTISIHRRLDKNLSLYRSFSLLGIIYKEVEDYENSILYHKKAVSNLQKVNDTRNFNERSLNDIGLTYRLMQKYDESIITLEQALSNRNLYNNDMSLYSKILDNLAYSKMLKGDTINVKNNFLIALKIRDSLKDYSGITISNIHLSEYYVKSRDTFNAILFAKQANRTANQINNNRDVLSSLLLLSKIEKDSSSFHLGKYVLLNKKLEKQQRLLKNKFARIRFETDEYISKSEKLSLQKTILIISIIASFLVFFLLYFLKTQKAKTKELLQETRQQKANEEIYGLMLKQQTTLEEGRIKERHRISEDLHDGVLGKIFGARMGLGFLEINGDKQELKKHQEYMNDLQKIEEEIRDISHELKNEILSSSNSYISLVESLVSEKSQIGDFNYTLTKEASSFWNECSDVIKINVYRVIQEALQNIIKYAKAKNVSLKFNYLNRNLNLTIKDDGVGFDVKIKKDGIGLANIHSRIKTIEGKVNIKSSLGKGTEIIIEIPNKI